MFEDHLDSILRSPQTLPGFKQQSQINCAVRVAVMQTVLIACIGQAVWAKAVPVKPVSVKAAPVQAPAQTQEQACRTFVQKFYNKYADRLRRDTNDDVPTKYGSDYSPKLRRDLQEDADAQAKARDLVGLDFDPILATNAEPHQKYVVEQVTKKGQSYWADIYGIDGKTKTQTPVVTAELVQVNWRWQFINFHYGKTKFQVNENLLSVLKQLRQDRVKYAKEEK